ncbi:hypothetical protein CH367_02410 [Leptospira barantonii]|uniref:Uncharacterized protein n=1 Tax=Leptospira barantonii TaxID=2023184 RepID=A0ABX4NV07_9LEPT|nr:hypothetical protein CH367_02410 [Leptospira barantonii]
MQGTSTKGPNTKFRKIAIECATERHTQFLGLNENYFQNSNSFFECLTSITKLPPRELISHSTTHPLNKKGEANLSFAI